MQASKWLAVWSFAILRINLRVGAWSFALLLLASPAFAKTPLCSRQLYEEQAYVVCAIDLRKVALEFFNLDQMRKPYSGFAALAKALLAEGKLLTFAMNGGMFGEDLKPVGLYIEKGAQAKKINLRDGPGNFHLKPNGVFYLSGRSAGILTSEAYQQAGIKPDHATQSGPMLVVKGQIHPKLSPVGTSAKIRNGVGQISAHQVFFAISEGPVTFHQFARFFRDELKCDNALFLDGSVSSLYSADLGQWGGFFPLGPMIGAYVTK